MEFNFLPIELSNILKKIDCNSFYEIRLRLGQKILIKTYENYFYLCSSGLTLIKEKGITCDKNLITEIIYNVTEHSLYAFNERLKNGYITTVEGVRIGIAGECVKNEEEVVTLKNITSLNIRIPHEIFGCSDKIYKKILSNKIYNTLIISPPTFGKTTILKDLALKIDKNYKKNILIIDERGEFESIKGEFIDSIKYSDKLYAFSFGLRSLAPEVIITDELCGEKDFIYAKKAVLSGVKILASIHGEGIDDVKKMKYYEKGIFERYVVLRSGGKPGIVDCFYNGELKLL